MKRLDPGGYLIIAGYRHSSIDAGNHLIPGKAEKGRVPESSHLLPLKRGSQGVRAVFNEQKIVFPAQRRDLFHVGGHAKGMLHDYRFRSHCNLFLQVLYVYIKIFFAAIDVHGL